MAPSELVPATPEVTEAAVAPTVTPTGEPAAAVIPAFAMAPAMTWPTEYRG